MLTHPKFFYTSNYSLVSISIISHRIPSCTCGSTVGSLVSISIILHRIPSCTCGSTVGKKQVPFSTAIENVHDCFSNTRAWEQQE